MNEQCDSYFKTPLQMAAVVEAKADHTSDGDDEPEIEEKLEDDALESPGNIQHDPADTKLHCSGHRVDTYVTHSQSTRVAYRHAVRCTELSELGFHSPPLSAFCILHRRTCLTLTVLPLWGGTRAMARLTLRSWPHLRCYHCVVPVASSFLSRWRCCHCSVRRELLRC
jgi:hypothetical protein